MKSGYLLFGVLWVLTLLHSACFDDKGNYIYSPINGLTIEVPEEVAVLANADTIKVFPKVISDLEGEILPGNPNYTYKYQAAKIISSGSSGALFLLDSTYSRDLVIPTKLEPGKYQCWLEVTDRRTEVATSVKFALSVSSVTTEGWMVLCEEGEDARVRLDMIARISEERSVQTYDILANYLPDLYGAYSLKLMVDKWGIDDYIYLLSGSGCYQLEPESLISGPEYSMDYEFAKQDRKHVPSCMGVTYGYRLIVDQDHEVYAMENNAGAIYELPVNQDEGTRFKVAPYVIADCNTSGNRCTSAILYDTDHKRFVQWTENNIGRCFPIPDPEDAKFSYSTGKELVYMEPTLNGSTIAYAILKDEAGKFYLCGISMAFSFVSTVYKQVYFSELPATNIGQATAFAFHSKLPYLFYAVGNQLYLYNLYDKETFPMFSLPSENITMLKFNLFVKNYRYNNRPDSFLNIPEQLIIGSENTLAEDANKGVLRFYEVQPLNAVPVLMGEPYRGFGKIKDVVYRERN